MIGDTNTLKKFGKLTVIKTLMLSKLSHIATVLPTPSKLYCKKFEKIMVDFIRGEQKIMVDFIRGEHK